MNALERLPSGFFRLCCTIETKKLVWPEEGAESAMPLYSPVTNQEKGAVQKMESHI